MLKLLLIISISCVLSKGSSSGGRSSSSRSSSSSFRSSYYSPSISRYTSSNAPKPTTFTYKTTTTVKTNTYNKYLWDGRTYKPLYDYYLPLNYYNPIGYYSQLYLMTYYDGYGYNFYYGEYGYYQDSLNEIVDDGPFLFTLLFCWSIPV